MREDIDEIDMQIFELIKRNGCMPNTRIAEQLNLSEAATRKRLKRLIDNDIIRVGAHFNYMKLGHASEGNIKIKVDMRKLEHISKTLLEMDSILYLAHLTGAADFDADFSVRTQEEMRELIKTIHSIDGILDIEVSIRIELLKSRYDIFDSSQLRW